jgi:hypothetical protein
MRNVERDAREFWQSGASLRTSADVRRNAIVEGNDRLSVSRRCNCTRAVEHCSLSMRLWRGTIVRHSGGNVDRDREAREENTRRARRSQLKTERSESVPGCFIDDVQQRARGVRRAASFSEEFDEQGCQPFPKSNRGARGTQT